ncbi:MAG: LysR family transcriptional regulator [Pseudomonadales bacterium]|nr:LysR family transcriptional regulator [Pseudomonadales bacterium]
MDNTALTVFVTVAEHQSFAEAARHLRLSTSKVSHQIQKLEQELDVRLFYRTTRQVRLTEIGETLHDKARQMLVIGDEMQALANMSNGQASGRLRISAPLALSREYLGGWLIEFKQRYPDVTVELVSSNHNLDFHQYELDFAIRQGPLPDSNFYARKLADIYFGLFASADFVQQYGLPESLEKLGDYPCICNGSDGRMRGFFLNEAEKSIIFRPKQYTLLDDAGLIYQAVESGLGIGFLAQSMTKDAVASGQLVPILENHWPKASEMFLVYLDNQRLTARHQRFIEFMLEKRGLL